jgi:hypothetical protein
MSGYALEFLGDNLPGQFSRNRNPKGFKDTKWKHDYPGLVWTHV